MNDLSRTTAREWVVTWGTAINERIVEPVFPAQYRARMVEAEKEVDRLTAEMYRARGLAADEIPDPVREHCRSRVVDHWDGLD